MAGGPGQPGPPAYIWTMHGRIPLMLVLALLLGPSGSGMAAGPYQDRHAIVAGLPVPDTSGEAGQKEPQRLVAAALALTLGPFAAHRLYLGTDVKVPVVYGLTFGGFGLLVLVDLGHILFTKDLAAYRHNGRVFMWASGKPPPLTPP